MTLILADIAVRERIAARIQGCATVKAEVNAEYNEARELVYVWSHLESNFREFLDVLLPKLAANELELDPCEAEQSIRDTLEQIFELIQLPRTYRRFICSTDEK